MENYIYADCAATTPVRKEVLEAMLPYFCDSFANPSGLYDIAFSNKLQLENVRECIAKSLNCKKNEIYFVSGGTEADNWALRIGADYGFGKPHIITTKIEHHAILNVCDYLERKGYVEVTKLDVDTNGIVDLDMLRESIKENTTLISIMAANNEIGTIQPLSEIGKIAAERNIIFHTDAVQAYGHMHIPVSEYGISILSASAHKFNGPKGIGFIYISDSVDKKPLLFGGGQEAGLRAGTENVPAIIGMGEAVRFSYDKIDSRHDSIEAVRNHIISRIQKEIECSYLNGSMENRLANNINFSFDGIKSSKLITILNKNGIYASSGSACNSKSILPSHVLKAIGRSDELALGSLRLTIDERVSIEDANRIVDVLTEAVDTLRYM